MSKLIAVPTFGKTFIKVVEESKKPVKVNHAKLMSELAYREYGTTMIKPNPFKVKKARSDYDLKGVIGGVRNYQLMNRLDNLNSVVYRCPYFSLAFYPPEHFMGLAKKSTPAIHIHYKKPSFFLNANLRNGKSLEENIKFLQSNAFQDKRAKLDKKLGTSFLSLFPKDWAYIRVRVRKLLRPCFHDAWTEFRAPDGLYIYNINIFSDKNNEKEYQKHIRQSVGAVAKMDMKAFVRNKKGQNWVHFDNSRVNVSVLNRVLSLELAPFRYKRVPDK